MKKESIILIGGGGHCVSCIDVIEQEAIYEIAGIIDLPEKVGQSILGYKIIGSDQNLNQIVKTHRNFLITIGQISSPDTRIKIFENLVKLGVNTPIIKSPLSYVSKNAKIGTGTIIMHHAIVNANAMVGINCILNSKSLIEHDAEIGDHSHISTAAIVNGGVKVGKRSFYGSNAVSKQGIVIPESSFIKANSIVK
jgi:sugar O-acyltransferase (sialic acid O-acetyltransferase NeuD family)